MTDTNSPGKPFHQRDSNTEVAEGDAADILRLLKSSEIELWVDGGWGVDALLGKQTRSHGDIDIVIRDSAVGRLIGALGAAGFQRAEKGRPFNFVMTDSRRCAVDVHTVVFDTAGNGLYGPQPGDGSGMKYPASAFKGEGLIGGQRVRCMTAEYQVENHRGYVPDERDIHDVCALHDRFGIPVPDEFGSAGTAGRAGAGRAENEAVTLVERGYDAIDEGYSRWADRVDPPLRLPYIERVLAMSESMPSRVVELGCGPGVPVGEYLAKRCTYVGVDISAAMLRQATVNVPGGIFIQADMSTIMFAENSIDVVVAFYSIIHLPREKHMGLFHSVAKWLRPGGWLVATLGTGDNPGATEADWLGGGPMFWSGFDANTNVEILKGAGFEVREASIVDQSELGNPVQFQWVIARRPAARTVTDQG